ncbi:MAG: ABC transporter ATP-binding protein [Methylococcus sp.]|nr:MAG: ABC transporter ATP-binding protein [Methylococcus sp.]
MSHKPALDISELSYSFGSKTVLDRIGFRVERGECRMLLGPNGAGKTTLFSLVTRLYDSGQGRIEIAGFDLARDGSKALSRLGVVFQQTTLDLDLSILQNLRYHASLHGMSRKDATRRIEDELERQEMFDRRNEKVRYLNGGHRRRVEIARALLHEPSILLLDEPTVGLDIPSREGIVRYMHNLCSEKGIAILWATHLIDEVAQDDRITILHEGRLVAQGDMAGVLQAADAADIESAFRNLTGHGMAH